MASGGTVTVDFAAETAKFTSELKKARADLKQTGVEFESLANIAKTALAIFAGGSVLSGIRASAQAADEFGKTADKIGITTKALASFQLAAELAGVSMQTMDKILVESQKRLGEAALGTGKATKFIAALGLSVEELQKLKPDELFQTYADAIGTLENRSERFAAAQGLFGKSAEQAFNLIEAGRPAIEEAAAAVDRYGLALGRVDIAQIEAANDKLDLLGKISATTGQRIAAGLAPFVNALADDLLGVTGNTEGAQRAAEAFGAVAYTAFQIVANAAHALTAAFFGVAAGGARILQALTFGDVSQSFAASVDANLAKADAALLKVKSIEDIQQGIVAALEKSRADAAAAVAAQQGAPIGTETIADDGSDELIKSLQALGIAHHNEMLKISDETEREIVRVGQAISSDYVTGLQERTQHFQNEADRRVEIEQQTQDRMNAFQQFGLANAAAYLQGFGGKYKAAAMAISLIQKQHALSQAFIATKASVIESFKNNGGYPWGIPAAVAMAAIGAANIAAIAGIQPGSGGSGGGGGVGGSAAIAAPNNSLFNDSGDSPQDRGADARPSVQVYVNGVVTHDVIEMMLKGLEDAISGQDIVFIPSGSRQAMEIRNDS